jgi:hypothetical protein
MHPAEAWPHWDAIEQSVKDETPFAIDEINAMLKANQLRHQYLQIELHHHLWVRVSKSLDLHYHREAS